MSSRSSAAAAATAIASSPRALHVETGLALPLGAVHAVVEHPHRHHVAQHLAQRLGVELGVPRPDRAMLLVEHPHQMRGQRMGLGGGDGDIGPRRLARRRNRQRREVGRVARAECRRRHVQRQLRPVGLQPGGVLVAHLASLIMWAALNRAGRGRQLPAAFDLGGAPSGRGARHGRLDPQAQCPTACRSTRAARFSTRRCSAAASASASTAQEKTNVEEYCVSEGWIRVAAGRSRDRFGNPMTIKLKGNGRALYRRPEAQPARTAKTEPRPRDKPACVRPRRSYSFFAPQPSAATAASGPSPRRAKAATPSPSNAPLAPLCGRRSDCRSMLRRSCPTSSVSFANSVSTGSSAGRGKWFRATSRAGDGLVGFAKSWLGNLPTPAKIAIQALFSQFSAFGTALELYPASTRKRKRAKKGRIQMSEPVARLSRPWSQRSPPF